MAMKQAWAWAALLVVAGVATPAFGAQTIVADTTVKGRIEKGDPKVQKYFHGDTYTYIAQAGEEVWIAWQDRTMGLSAMTEVHGPNGFSVADVPFGSGRLLRFPQAGRYSILLWSTSYGDYELSVFRLDTAASSTSFAAGQSVRGSFSTADQPWKGTDQKEDKLIYRARAGETVSFHLEGQQSSIGLVVKGPDGLQNGAGFADTGRVLDVSSALKKAGDYTVTVIGTGGNYTLEARSRMAAAEAPATPLALGHAVQVHYSPDGAVNERNQVVEPFKVRLQRGQHVAVVRDCACEVTVRGPDGQTVKTVVSAEGRSTPYEYFRVTRTEFTAPVDGDFRIEAPVSKDTKPSEANLRLVSAEQGEALMAQVRERVKQASDADRAKVEAAVRRGDEWLAAGDNQRALDAYQGALQIDIENIHANFNAGVAAFRIGGLHSFDTARLYFEKVVELDPSNEAAKKNIAAATEADGEFRRNSQAAYEQRQRENSQALGNALQAFAVGVQLGNQINAARAAPPPAPAPATATAPSSYSQPGQQASSNSQLPCAQPGVSYTYGSRDCGASSGKTHNPANDGTNCVHVVPNPGNWGSAAYFFVNGCGWPVTVAWDRNSQGRYTSMTNIALGGHYPTGFAQLPSPFPYIACKKRPEIGADIYNDNGRHICIGPAA